MKEGGKGNGGMNRLARRCPPARHGFRREPQIFPPVDGVRLDFGGKVGAGKGVRTEEMATVSP